MDGKFNDGVGAHSLCARELVWHKLHENGDVTIDLRADIESAPTTTTWNQTLERMEHMTYKEKVAWLQRYLKAREKAQFLEGCVQEMEAEAQGMRTRLDGMPGAGRDTARLARSVEKVKETRKMWNDQLDRCGELRIELVAELAKIQHPLAQEVLRRRYMNGESYAEICDALALVERRVYQLHRLGVNKVCEPEN